ncbi:MAG: hypothetical protein M3Y75_03035 [Actinomycetota bacterium]|nr:hypothetical protein [Actinomycetota bacterium]
MKRIGLAVVCCALVVSVMAGASIAGAEEPVTEPTPAEVENSPKVEVTTPGSVVTAEGSVINEPSLLESEASSLLVGCVANFICVYSGTEYTNPYVAIECAFGGTVGLSGNRFSATNRCGNKTNWLRVSGTATACMNPGGNRPHPGAFNEVFVAVQYGAFC